MDLITPEVGLIFWQTIVFLVLMLILAKFAWKPILGAVRTREESINEALASAEDARKEMQNLKADKIVAKAKENIEMEKRAAMADIKNQVATLSIEIAEKVIGKELSTEEKQHQMIDKMLKDATLN